MNKIKLIILDVDGVMTNGKKTYDNTGLCISKQFCDKDFTALKRIKAANISICFLSGDQNINEKIAKNRNIDFYLSRNTNKIEFIPEFKKIYNCNEKQMLYIGDDLFDLDIMKKVKYKFCPNDAILEIKEICKQSNILKAQGGNNVICELYYKLIERKLIDIKKLKEIEELDKNEKF